MNVNGFVVKQDSLFQDVYCLMLVPVCKIFQEIVETCLNMLPVNANALVSSPWSTSPLPYVAEHLFMESQRPREIKASRSPTRSAIEVLFYRLADIGPLKVIQLIPSSDTPNLEAGDVVDGGFARYGRPRTHQSPHNLRGEPARSSCTV